MKAVTSHAGSMRDAQARGTHAKFSNIRRMLRQMRSTYQHFSGEAKDIKLKLTLTKNIVMLH
jgi:hypothetical protein